MDWTSQERQAMQAALDQARLAANLGEVPVGAVITMGDEIVAAGCNLRESRNSPTAHAEILAIEEAARKLGRWRLTECTLYVTLEPCLMCSGAIVNSRVSRVVYGARDPKAGGVDSLYALLRDSRLNHNPQVQEGLMADQCAEVLREFFSRRRTENKARRGRSAIVVDDSRLDVGL